jgi:acetolactate synthase-1/2/3 large subunit
VLAEADVVLVIDSDVPWIPAVNRPSGDAAIYYVDVDPLKSQLQMWHVPARRFAAANSKAAVAQIAAHVREHDLGDQAAIGERQAAAASGTSEYSRNSRPRSSRGPAQVLRTARPPVGRRGQVRRLPRLVRARS